MKLRILPPSSPFSPEQKFNNSLLFYFQRSKFNKTEQYLRLKYDAVSPAEAAWMCAAPVPSNTVNLSHSREVKRTTECCEFTKRRENQILIVTAKYLDTLECLRPPVQNSVSASMNSRTSC